MSRLSVVVRYIAGLCSLIILLSMLCVVANADGVESGDIDTVNIVADSSVGDITYAEYIKKYSNEKDASLQIKINPADYISSTGSVTNENGQSVITGNTASVVWEFAVQDAGLYELCIDYFPTVSKGGTIERTLKLDGVVPFEEAKFIEFSRNYIDGEVKKNSKNNDVTPEQIETPKDMKYYLHDANRFYSGNFKIFLSEGVHTLSLESVKESLEIKGITFIPPKMVATYKDYYNTHKDELSSQDAEVIIVEAENIYSKSSFTVYPTSDKSSAGTYPQHPAYTLLNIIDGTKWSKVGQWLEWEVDVPDSGFYAIAPRFKQNTYEGGYVSRQIRIDGNVPFEEAKAVEFKYTTSWAVTPLGEEKPFLFYLEKGKHIVSMEVVLGNMSEVISKVKNSLAALNADYRRILMITGTSPDVYRDYHFENLIPDVLKDMDVQAKQLQSAIDFISKNTNSGGSFTSSIGKLIVLIDQITKDPEQISEVFSTFKDNLSSLGTWVQNCMEQPLSIDRIYLIPQNAKTPDSGEGFFSNMVFKLKQFVMSFTQDYQSFASDISEEDYKNNNVIKVWMTTGREQCQIMQKLTEQSFTPKYGTKINIQLVTPTSLLPATLAGTGPDVAMNVPSHTPIDFAIRGAAVDLSQFEGYEDVIERFSPAATTPFIFGDSTYALPETMSFLMMFYRTDIFEELKLQPPKTWDEFYQVIWELQQQNLNVGFPINAKTNVVSNLNLYGLELFLYQNGGTIYNKAQNKSAMSRDLNIECFEKMAELFTLYRLPVDYDFANRFRSGEMPLGIVEYTAYNQLTIFASEIKGLWKMLPVPGTLTDDGTIDYTSPVGATGVMILSNATDVNKSWDFLNWVTSSETQSRYATELESVLGVAAKQATSNLEAISGMSWTNDEYTALSTQMKMLRGTPEIPGGYYTARGIDFAFAGVYSGGKEPSASLSAQVKRIDDEIYRKRKEFGLN